MDRRPAPRLAGLLLALLLLPGEPAAAEDAPSPVEAFDAFWSSRVGLAGDPEADAFLGTGPLALDGKPWIHAAETSVCVAFATNRPARTHLEWGETAEYGQKTKPTGRPQFRALHRLTGLKPGRKVFMKIVAEDEKGVVASFDGLEAQPKKDNGLIRIPEGVKGPPWMLEKPGGRYVVTRDLEAPDSAIVVVASGVSVELDGHTVTYGNDIDVAGRGACGVRTWWRKPWRITGTRVFNGTLRSGKARNESEKPWDVHNEPMWIMGSKDLEVAGVTFDYDGPQVEALLRVGGEGPVQIHHNAFLDRGTTLVEGRGTMDALFAECPATISQNLVLRTRHRGIQAAVGGKIERNEVWVDSWGAYSYGIHYADLDGTSSGLQVTGNRVLGSGFAPIGIGPGENWGSVKVVGNLVRLEGRDNEGRGPKTRGGDDSEGRASAVVGLRLKTPFGPVLHEGNFVLVRGAEGQGARGILVSTGEAPIAGLRFAGNTVKMVAADRRGDGATVVAVGAPGLAPEGAVLLEGNTFVTNATHAQFGDWAGGGGLYRFVSNRFVRAGEGGRYHTVRMGWRGREYDTFGHGFYDSRFEGGAGFDEVAFDGVQGRRFEFSVGWVLALTTAPGASVAVKDKTGAAAWEGTAGADGRVAIPLAEYLVTYGSRDARTPHEVVVTLKGKRAAAVVTMDRNQDLRLAP